MKQFFMRPTFMLVSLSSEMQNHESAGLLRRKKNFFFLVKICHQVWIGSDEVQNLLNLNFLNLKNSFSNL